MGMDSPSWANASGGPSLFSRSNLSGSRESELFFHHRPRTPKIWSQGLTLMATNFLYISRERHFSSDTPPARKKIVHAISFRYITFRFYCRPRAAPGKVGLPMPSGCVQLVDHLLGSARSLFRVGTPVVQRQLTIWYTLLMVTFGVMVFFGFAFTGFDPPIDLFQFFFFIYTTSHLWCSATCHCGSRCVSLQSPRQTRLITNASEVPTCTHTPLSGRFMMSDEAASARLHIDLVSCVSSMRS